MRDQLLAAWKRWDANPGGVETARTMADACKAPAEALGMKVTDFRDALSAHRRAGFTYEDTLDSLGV